jgi:hypothetical protein
VVSFELQNRVPAARGPMLFFNWDIAISLKNSEFEHKHAETK